MSVVRRIQIGENHKSAEVLNRPTDDILTLSGQTPGATFAGFATTPALAAEATARGAGDAANAASIATNTTSIASNTAAISAEQTARAAGDAALQALVASAFPPSSIPNLVLWLDANQITGQADNTAMPSWTNRAPGGATVVQGNAAYQPLFRVINGIPLVRMVFAGGFGVNFGSAIAPDESTTFLVAQNPTPVSGLQQTIFHLGPKDSSAAAQFTYAVGQNPNQQFDLVQASPSQPSHRFAGMAVPATWGILAVAASVSGTAVPEGPGTWMYLNGQRAFRRQSSGGLEWASVAAQSSGFIGGLVEAGGGYWTGDLRCVLHFNRRLSETEIQRVSAYLASTYGLTQVGAVTRNIVFANDSQTVGYTLSDPAGPSGYVDQLLPSLPATVRSYNIGVVGQTIVQAAALAATRVDPLYDATVPKNTLVMWGGTNDLVAVPANPTAAYNSLVAYCQARRAKGFKVVVVTALPRLNTTQLETDRTAFNAAIRANWATFADAIADVGANASIGAYGQQNNTTYYQTDATHPNQTGYGIAAGIILTAVNSL